MLSATDEFVDEVAALGKMVEDSVIHLAHKSRGGVPTQVVNRVQKGVDGALGTLAGSRGRSLGRLIPLDAFYALRSNLELWRILLDVFMSVLGLLSSPLWFSFHLLRLTSMESAKIVMKSITTNWRRLGNTLVLALLLTYLFSVVGLVYFQDVHLGADVAIGVLESANCTSGDCTAVEDGSDDNPSACSSLLTCFVSYSYAGLMQSGITGYLQDVQFPTHVRELGTVNSAIIFLDIVFMLTTSCFVIAIITGIICDTFGELRAEADAAKHYRSSTCFITGIPFSDVAAEDATQYLNYLYLMLSLKRNQDTIALERMVIEQIERGEISWMPVGRCRTQDRRRVLDSER